MRVKLEAITLDTIAAAKTIEDAFDYVVDCSRKIGVELVSYHRFDPLQVEPGVPQHSRFEILSSGFPEAWLKKYMESDYRLIDPITGLAACIIRPVLWSDVAKRVDLTSKQAAYLDDLFSWLAPGDGLAIPLFGPNGIHGYAGMGWHEEGVYWDSTDIRILQTIAESFHLRMCEFYLEDHPPEVPDLTDVQITLVNALASGHPDPMICGMVNLRPDALHSAIQRLLKTMNVTDRPSALIRAEALGLIKRPARI